MRHLLRISHLHPWDLEYLLERAEHLKRHPYASRQVLKARTALLYFAKPSTRTRLSTETAVVRLGGVPLTVGPDELQLGRGETIADTAKVVGSYAAAAVIRTYRDADVEQFALHSGIPVVNALTDGHHPLQAITDLMTIREYFGELSGRKLAYVGARNNVSTSLGEAAALAGMAMSTAGPGMGDDPFDAVKDADVVYTDVWTSMGDPEARRAERHAILEPFRVTPELMAAAHPHAIFMHCLPAHRGEEVAAEVIDGPASAVFRQAANRLPVAQAVLETVLGGAS
ncbi:ornithine carbamoyltransferase [Nonomuraea soli]|uniref:Ornithine carbamoyltransferase n=1 Tax=Nonomuraea soli TaxID=1032476 RepID=A0A7W0HNX0_9ACTN|nr:ornithine carbamoyltransferase [Nonomuraea soli]MBA2890021.1 ornithine carbamoyltransferase [Nonomuraea soli]